MRLAALRRGYEAHEAGYPLGSEEAYLDSMSSTVNERSEGDAALSRATVERV